MFLWRPCSVRLLILEEHPDWFARMGLICILRLGVWTSRSHGSSSSCCYRWLDLLLVSWLHGFVFPPGIFSHPLWPIRIHIDVPSWERPHIPSNVTFEDDVPFPHVSSLDGTWIMSFCDFFWCATLGVTSGCSVYCKACQVPFTKNLHWRYREECHVQHHK